MYERVQRPAKTSSDSSASNQFAPRPFVVQPQTEEVSSQPDQTVDLQAKAEKLDNVGSGFPDPAVFTRHLTPPKIPRIQMKLTIGQPGDKSEQEADRVAADVVQRMNEPESKIVQREAVLEEDVQTKPLFGTIQQKAAPEEEKEVQTKLLAASVAPFNQQIQNQERIVQLTPTSNAIKPLLSYSVLDWEVSDADETKILRFLRKDSDLSATITDLNSDGILADLFKRVNKDNNRRELIQILGSKLDLPARALVEPHIKSLGEKWELQFNLGRLGVTQQAPAFNNAAFKSLVSSDPSAPFTGLGATGVNPTQLGIPLQDQISLGRGEAATTKKYTNPIPGSLPDYLATLTPAQRKQQAELLLRQQISSVMADSYAGKIPSRAQIMRAAAKAHNLHPHLIGAFIMAEQRDQSKNEDAKDYIGATNLIKKGNTSIGLGQVVVSTAKNNDLFADLISSNTRKDLDHDETAKRLASDEFNIFATARYIRKVADDGVKIPIAKLPNTKSKFPGIDMKAFAQNSVKWPDDNIRALASEYTSRAWDDNLSEGWGDFVFEAYKDVLASGVF